MEPNNGTFHSSERENQSSESEHQPESPNGNNGEKEKEEPITYGDKTDAGEPETGASPSGDAPEDPAGQQEAPTDAEGETLDHLKEELERQKKAAEENYQRFLRVQADFENYKRRTRQEKEEMVRYASMKLIEQLLPAIDNFERAIQASSQNKDFDSLAKGVEMTFRQFMEVLEKEGLQAIEAVGRPFNPEFHEAIMQVESEEHEEGIVVEEIQKGYMLKEKVLRPSLVKVSK